MSAEFDFYRTERPRLAAAGIFDYDEQSAELARRWNWFAGSMSRQNSAQDDDEIKLTSKLPTSELKSMNLELVRTTHTRQGSEYMYKLKNEAVRDGCTTARCGKRRRGEVHATTVLSRAKKDTLQALCEDIDIPVTGNKDNLICRIIDAIAADDA